MQHAQKMILVSPETLSTVKDPRPVSSETFTRSRLDQELKEVLDRTGMTPYDKVQEYNQILQRYLTFYNKTTKRPMTVKVLQDQRPVNEGPDDQQQPQDEDDAPVSTEKLLVNFPVSVKKKAQTFFKMIKDSKGVLDFNEQGELLVDGEVIEGSHVSDLVYDVLFGKTGFEPRGMQEFLKGLVRLNVPERLIHNKNRRTMLRQLKQKTPPGKKTQRVNTPVYKPRKQASKAKSVRKSSRVGRLNWENYT